MRTVRRLARIAVVSVSMIAGLIAPVSTPAEAVGCVPTPASPSPYISYSLVNLPGGHPVAETTAALRPRLQKLYDAGLRWNYLFVSWSELQTGPNPSDYKWTDLDNYVSVAHDIGLDLVIQVDISANSGVQLWAGPTRRNEYHVLTSSPMPQDLTLLTRFWSDLVNRYRPCGVLDAMKGWNGYGVRAWEIDNEPENAPAMTPDWSTMPKDYSAYAAAVNAVAKAADPGVTLLGPALSQNDAGGTGPTVQRLGGIPWLDEMLSSTPSEWASDTYRAQGTRLAGGKYLDAFSFHYDNPGSPDVDPRARLTAVKQALARHTGDAYPTAPNAPVWYTEGNATSYDGNGTSYDRYAWAELQLTGGLMAEGVAKAVLDTGGSQPADANWPSTPMFASTQALTRWFPDLNRISDESASFDPLLRRVNVVRRIDASCRRTHLIWAKNLPIAGPDFTIDVPVRGLTAQVFGADFVTRSQTVVGGKVTVTLRQANPSPVVIVAETGTVPSPCP